MKEPTPFLKGIIHVGELMEVLSHLDYDQKLMTDDYGNLDVYNHARTEVVGRVNFHEKSFQSVRHESYVR